MRVMAALLVFLAGCAGMSEGLGDTSAARSSWQGAAYEDVVRSWGAPARSTKLTDGRDQHTWVSENISPRGALWPSIGVFGGTGGVGGVGVGVGTGPTMGPGYGYGESQRCDRTLFFESGRVVEQTWRGPPDFCSSFRRPA